MPQNNNFVKKKLSDGKRLLDREQPEGYFNDWVEAPKERNSPDSKSQLTSYFVFRLAKEWLALPTQSILEVTECLTIRRIPHLANEVIKGIVNIQGELRIAISLRHLIKIDGENETKNQTNLRIYRRLIVFGKTKAPLVTDVDEVLGVIEFQSKALEETPINIRKSLDPFTIGILLHNGHRVGILNTNLIIERINEEYL